MQDTTSLRTVPSRPTLPQRGQTHLPPLPNLRRTRTTQTADPTQLPLQAHRRPTLSGEHVAHPRIARSHQSRLPHPTRVRGLAFHAQFQHHVLLVREHVPENQAGSQRLARVGLRRPGQTSTVPRRLQSQRRDRPRPRQDRQESRATVPGQDDAQQFLGEIRATGQQESSRDHLVARTTLQIVKRRQSGTPNPTRHQRRDDRSGPQARGRGRDGPGQHQHLRGLFHHVLGSSQTLPGRTQSTLAPTSPLLRHRFHHLLAPTRATHATLRRPSGRIHQRIETR